MQRPAAAGMVCAMLYWRALIYNSGAAVRPYIHYYNGAAALPCLASGVAVVSGIGAGTALDGMPSSAAQAACVFAVLRALE